MYTVPEVFVWKVPPLKIITSLSTVNSSWVRLFKLQNPEMPLPTFKLAQFAATSIVTVCPSAIITSSEKVGAIPPGQGAFGVCRTPISRS